MQTLGKIDSLINAVGGNLPGAVILIIKLFLIFQKPILMRFLK